jgi:hypothetical protein
MLPDQWMSDVYIGLALQALCRMASGVGCEIPGTPAQKSNAAPVSDAHEEIQIQGERLSTGKNPATTAMLIAKLYHVRSAVDNLA